MSNLTTYPSRAALFQGLSDVVESQLRVALSTKGHAVLAVPGGTTPAPFFEILRKTDLDWANVTVLLTDERFVPETSDRSNTRLLKQSLLQDKAAAATLLPMYQRGDTPETVLPYLRSRIEQVLPLDVCVLGMGADMHTASIFPEADLLDEALSNDAPVLLPMRAPGAPEPRLTLTAPVLRGAGAVHLLIAGAQKRDAYNDALADGPIKDAPVRVILQQAHTHFAQ